MNRIIKINNNESKWEKMVSEGKKIDNGREQRDKRISAGLLIKKMQVIYYMKNEYGTRCGFAIEEYELPLDKEKMQMDKKEWKSLEWNDGFTQERIN